MILDIHTKIITGRSEKEAVLSNLAKKHKRILVVCDPSVDQAKIDAVLNDFKDKGSDCVLFNDIPAKPTSKVVEKLADIIIKGYIDALLAVGGIKTLNLAKAAVAVKNGFPVDDMLDNESIPSLDNNMDYVEIPSSMRNHLMFTPFAAVVDSRNRSLKYIDTGIIPSTVISDPDFCDSLSSKMFDSIVFELVLSSLEGLASLKKCYLSDSLYKSALSRILNNEEGFKLDSVSEIAVSISLAQSVTGPGAGFFLSCFLNSRSSVSKSVLSVILLPWLLEWYFTRYPALVETVNEIMKTEEAMDTEDIIQYLRKKITMKGLPLRLSEAGVNKNIYPYVLSSLDQLNKFSSLPAKFSGDEISEILKKAY